jgi:hypothetical protein
VERSLRSRDLSHKGDERRQSEYVNRTIKKALGFADRVSAQRGFPAGGR